jgi:hypothetical protein
MEVCLDLHLVCSRIDISTHVTVELEDPVQSQQVCTTIEAHVISW